METEVEEVPLGPLMGATIEFWRTRTGTSWHGNPECNSLRSTPVSSELAQPDHGDIDGKVYPDRLHCQPAGRVGAYVTAAGRLRSFMSETTRLGRASTEGYRPLAALKTAWNPLDDLGDDRDLETLRPLWDRALARRHELVGDVARTFHSNSERMAVASAAAWVRSGRKPREHARQYAMFLARAVAIHEQHKLGANWETRSLINSRILSEWLEDVGAGTVPALAMKRIAAEEIRLAARLSSDIEDTFSATVERTLTAVAQAWTDALETIAVAHRSDALVVFNEYDLPASGRGIAEACLTISGGAELHGGNLHWVVTKVPLAFRLMLQEGERGPSGLVLVEEWISNFDVDRCADLLRRVLVAEGIPQASRQVREIKPRVVRVEGRGLRGVELEPSDLPQRPRDGFSMLGVGRGLTVVDFAPFLRG
ncbi:hypothetical protein [Cryobacterium melibiosiphilum]|uniref:hypothetical protein n=1 Tax=Cryobacterium melibiosiphilum TaxID=995039 RepID=UPI0011C21603|nr:hypothetical protein [Cryobacterium melibiosiphilum]